MGRKALPPRLCFDPRVLLTFFLFFNVEIFFHSSISIEFYSFSIEWCQFNFLFAHFSSQDLWLALTDYGRPRALCLPTPPLWTDLVKMFSRKLRHVSFFSFECTDFKNVIFENIHWAHSEDAEVAEVKRPRNPK